jgi:hypothetical protein
MEHLRNCLPLSRQIMMHYEVLCDCERQFMSVVKPMPQEIMLLLIAVDAADTSWVWLLLQLLSCCRSIATALRDCSLKMSGVWSLSMLREELGQRLSTEHTEPLVATASQRRKRPRMGSGKSGTWSIDRFMLTDDDFDPYCSPIDLITILPAKYRRYSKFLPEFRIYNYSSKTN